MTRVLGDNYTFTLRILLFAGRLGQPHASSEITRRIPTTAARVFFHPPVRGLKPPSHKAKSAAKTGLTL